MARSDDSQQAIKTLSARLPTLATGSSAIDAGTCYKYIVYNGEDALASYPATMSIFNLAVIKYSCFVELNGSAVYRLRKAFSV